MTRIHIEIENHLPLPLNRLLRAHWAKRSRQQKLWDLLIFEALWRSKQLPKKPLEKVHIRLVRHAHRTLDYDGLVGSLKPVVDSLKKAGVISDDTWPVTGAWQVDQVFRAKKSGTLLEIEINELSNRL